MNSIFQELVELYGYPGDFRQDWLDLIEKQSVLSEKEYNKAKSWVWMWTSASQEFFLSLKKI